MKLGERTDKCRKMRHNCEKHGCFEKKYRCQLGKIDHLFPGENGMTDIDGYCLVNGKKIFLEWKTSNGNIQGKQLDALRALSKEALIIVAWGNPIEMIPTAFFTIQNDVISERFNGESAPIEFDRIIKNWANNNG